MAGSKKTLLDVAVHDLDIDGETYILKEMSAMTYLSFNDIQEEIDSDKAISERANGYYRAAAMAVVSLVDKSGKYLFESSEYRSLLDQIKIDRLMQLSIEIMRINGMSETEEQTAKNS